MALTLFARTKHLENQIDEFLGTISHSVLHFQEAISAYLKSGVTEDFKEQVKAVALLESRGDELRRSVLTVMFIETLMPDARGDILKLLEDLDRILNQIEEALFYFSIERPEIPESLQEGYQNLTRLSAKAVESLILTARAFFRSAESIQDHMHKVLFYESEADKVLKNLKRGIFKSDLDLAHKVHLRFFAERIAWISDLAEDIADDLVIYAIKRAP